MSLGGVRDEAEIRGHRRTYIGALPGRLVRALRDAGTMNPVIMLDEVDKVGADWRGDPSAALLEVLDPAQNRSFRDHYLDVELDLSEVVFIATGNMAETIPGTAARPHGGRALRRVHHGREGRDREGATYGRVSVTATGCARTRSPVSGRRASLGLWHRVHPRGGRAANSSGELGTLLRKTATGIASAPVQIGEELRDALGRQRFFQESAERTAIPGVATGLAVTGVGGDVLFIEATSMKGKDRLVLTGQLGDVMKDPRGSRSPTYAAARSRSTSTRTRSTAVSSTSTCLRERSPKDGPSAGITMRQRHWRRS